MQQNNVYQVLVNAANQWPEHPAVYDDFGTLTFSGLYEEAEVLKQQLISRGIGEGQAVGIMARNGRNFIVGIFAVLGTGACVMPMSHQLKRDELDEQIKHAALHFILDDLSGIDPMGSTDLIALKNGQIRVAVTTNPNIVFAPHVDNPAFMRFTSGTTGTAKGVIISHQSAIERIEGANTSLNLGPDDTVIWVLPIAYHFVVSILLYVRYGAAIAITKDFLPQSIIESINRFNGTLLYASPMQIRLMARAEEKIAIPSMKNVISTSAAISEDVCVEFYETYGIPVSQAYGIIEIGLPIINFAKSKEFPNAVGYALQDYDVAILDDNNQPVEDGESGHLAIKGKGMFDAYLNPPLTRDEVTKNGYFLTADFARKQTDGLIIVEGRQKSVINVSGNKVFPEEVEGILETRQEIEQAKISGVPHPIMGQIIQAEVVLKAGETINVEEVLTYCRKRLSTYKVPQRIVVVQELEMTKTGKLVR
ncbi:acyl--CoA ligase [Crocinitomicaceae bacterium CZZ-1]|uniref:Acyl--CoA ligase n=1 Tax=Taishania pollutisoli TaxID=2766479 RepID=A0A8J6TSE6_9FLAO|nr:class I adenylate-forming enzyme family protein [Taishania pollutisoli]MBC9811169.1 acyl--CoA ligase [Taishania pollutisoli]